MPLVDVEPEADGTQYWPKSHLDPRAPDLALELKEGDAAMEEMVSPGCAAGGLICFDYTCVHRGRANGDRERPVAYIVVATSPLVRGLMPHRDRSLLSFNLRDFLDAADEVPMATIAEA